MNILLFGDQAGNYHLDLRDKLHQKNNPILTLFLERANVALREEITKLPGLVRHKIPHFLTLLDLLELLDDPKILNPAIESAICTISQIACLICYQYSTLDCAEFIDPSSTRILGSCVGLLAGIAASSTRGLSDLPNIGVTLVRVAFRVGALVASLGDSLQQGSVGQESWSTAIKGINEDGMKKIIDNFHADKTTPSSKNIYISAVTSRSLTVSGPPTTLTSLVDSEPSLSALVKVRLPIHGPYHAEHLYSPKRLEELLQPFSEVLTSYTPRVPLISSFTGCPIPASTAFQLTETAVEEMLRKTLRWDRVVDGVASEVERLQIEECSILPAGPANTGDLMSAMKRCANCIVTLNQDLWNTRDQKSKPKSESGRLIDSKIAIVGMAGRFPNAANHELFWELLEKGTDTHKVIPKDRFDASHIDPTGHQKNTSHTPYGCFIDEPGLFDPRFFKMSPREATQTDPMHRLALLTAYEALEMSGYVPNRTSSTMLHRIGTFYGQTSDDWREIQEGQDIDTYFIPGGVRAFAPGRINYFFKFSGPSFSVDTACSSSFAALQLAVTSLRTGACDTAVTGGMNVMTNPDIFSGLSRGQFLSKTGNCQTFDNEADGYCRGEGVASIVLKRLEDAEADKDNILGVILESMTNHSADAISITHPHAPTQQYLYKQVLSKAAIDANDVSYVEMHGTGTQAGDGTEMESVTNVFASPDPKHRRSLEQPLHLGAVKANIGHGEAASGICALIKVLMMMEKNAIAPNCGIKRIINQGFPKDLGARNVRIPQNRTPWPRPEGQVRTVYVSNFSAAGGNTGLLLQDGPSVGAPESQDPRSTQIVSVSGRSKSSLRSNIQQLIQFISDNPSIDLPSLSYTTTARRMHYNYRIAVADSDISKVKAFLASSSDTDISPISPTAPQIAFVFTGQGSHYAALGKQLFQDASQFRSDIFRFEEMAQAQGLPSFLPLIDGTLSDISELSSTVVQLGSTCVQMALARLWISWGITPSVVLGHSLGEYAALNIAGVLSASDCIYLVGRRAHELESTCTPGTHAMLAVAASESSVKPYMERHLVEVACINSPSETVLGGPVSRIDQVAEDLSNEGFKTTKLRIPFAFHVSQVDPVLDSYEAIASGATFNTPSIPIISPLLGEVVRNKGAFNPIYLRRHARETVNLPNGLEAGLKDGAISDKTIWLEIGPHPVCSAMIKKTLGPSTSAVSSLRRNDDPWRVINTSLVQLHTAGLNIQWNEYQRDFNDAQRLLRLPTYGFDLKNYWINYVGNWCLTKGDIGTTTANSILPKSKLSTTSVHRIVEESIQGGETMVVVESDVSDPTLKAAVKGHMVNDSGLCPSSLYADMALTVAEYLYKQLEPNATIPAMNVGKMEVEKPFIAGSGSDPQLLRIRGVKDVKTGEINVEFYSVTPTGAKKTDHAKCIVEYLNAEKMLAVWQRSRYLVQPRIDALLNGTPIQGVEKLGRDMAYALFASFVKYGDSYRGMEEVALNAKEYEATAKVAFQTKEEDGTFTCSPYWIDSVGHLSGFILNVKEAVGSQSQVFVSHGWESMCFAKSISQSKTYRSYVKMQPAGEKIMAGDVMLFEEDEIIGVIGGLKFQCIPRSLLNTFLPPAGGSNRKTITPAAPAVKQAKPMKQITTESKPPPAVSASPPKSGQPDLASRALQVVADEVGVPISELSNNVVFEDIGVDSLMSLTITSRLREELEMDLGQSLFVDQATVASFIDYFPKSETVKTVSVRRSRSLSPPNTTSSSGASSSGSIEAMDDDATPLEREDVLFTPASSVDGGDIVETIRATIAEEMGVAVDEIVGATDFASLGMDSLMTLTVLANLREATGQDFDPNFFVDNTSMEAVAETLMPKKKSTPPTPATIDKAIRRELKAEKAKKAPPAVSLLLQGNPKTAKKTLFLFPDGSGSATSYAAISKIDPDVALYGLNCPYMERPEEFICGIPEISTLYKEEIQRRQPKGPYCLGGWSAGGITAYEISLQLIAEGETIERLILLDSPCPLGLEVLPPRLHHYFDDIGLLGTGKGKAPAWLMPHFGSTIRALEEYKPKLMDRAKAPQTFAIWATKGVCGGNPGDPPPPPKDNDPRSMTWLLQNRTDFGSNGWHDLLDVSKMDFRTVDCNHFTMMRDPAVHELAALIRQGLE